MNWWIAGQVVFSIFALYFFSFYMSTTAFPTLRGKRILLLIAHPDDEAMFFAPTLRWLTRPDLGNQIVILCFSSGDAEGLGHVRKDELKKSAMQLGIRSTEHVVIIEDEKFPDSMTVTWDSKAIGNILLRNFSPKIANTPATEAPTSQIDAIITFDGGGVSGHPNHIALFYGATAFLKGLMQRHTGWECPTKLYTLTSTNILRKYSGIFDTFVSVIACTGHSLEKGSFPTPLLIVSAPWDVWKAQRAMTTAHKSQMRWFRWGWIGFSRYMIVNDLTRQVSGAQTWKEARNQFAKAYASYKK